MASLQVKFPTSLSKCTTLCHLVTCDQHPLPDVLYGEDRATGFNQQWAHKVWMYMCTYTIDN